MMIEWLVLGVCVWCCLLGGRVLSCAWCVLICGYQHTQPLKKNTKNTPPKKAANTISVWNNGDGIPVEVHAGEGVYVPELIFGHLLTSSNYNDAEKKVGGVLCVVRVVFGGKLQRSNTQHHHLKNMPPPKQKHKKTNKRSRAGATATAPSSPTSFRRASSSRRPTGGAAGATSRCSPTTCRRAARRPSRRARRATTGRASRSRPT